jgi:hypothetical protein
MISDLNHEEMLACARRALADVNAEIAKLITLQKVWESNIKWNEDKIKEREKFARPRCYMDDGFAQGDPIQKLDTDCFAQGDPIQKLR